MINSPILFSVFGVNLDRLQLDIYSAQMSQEMYSSGVILLLITNLHSVEFEARKETAEIFRHVLRRQIGKKCPGLRLSCLQKINMQKLSLKEFNDQERGLRRWSISALPTRSY